MTVERGRWSWVPTLLLVVAFVLYVVSLVWISRGFFPAADDLGAMHVPYRYGEKAVTSDW